MKKYGQLFAATCLVGVLLGTMGLFFAPGEKAGVSDTEFVAADAPEPVGPAILKEPVITGDALTSGKKGPKVGSYDAALGNVRVYKEIDMLSGCVFKIAGTQVTSTAAELNYSDLTAGTGAVSKALVLDSSGNLTWPNNGDLTAATVGGSDLGSTSGEWGSVYMANSKGLYFGAAQSASLLHDGTTGLDLVVKTNDSGALTIKDDAGSAISFFTIDSTTGTPVVSILSNLSIANTIDILPATASGSDIGSATAEWGAIFMGDSKALSFGDGQDASIQWNTADLLIESDEETHIQFDAVGTLAMSNAGISAFVGAEDTGGADFYAESQDGGAVTTGNSGQSGGLFSIKTGDGSQGCDTEDENGAAGGALSLVAGAAGRAGLVSSGTATGGTGGAITATAGVGGGGGDASGTDGAGGGVTITGGASGTGGNTGADGGIVRLIGGASAAIGDGGAAYLIGGATTGGATGTGGTAYVAGGASGNATNGAGGATSATGGAGKGTGDGGAASLVGGAGLANDGDGGDIAITGGGATGASSVTGAVTIDAGALAAGATAGTISIGATNAESLTIGRTGKTTTIYGPTTIDTVSTEHGAGAIGTGVAPVTSRRTVNGTIITEIKLDLTGLESVATGDDVIGLSAATPVAYIGRYVVADYGIVYKVELICLEATAGGDDDVNVVANASGTLVVGDAGGTTYGVDGGDAAAGQVVENLVQGLTANHYLYLTAGTGDTAAAYSAGQFIVRLHGHAILQ